MMRELRQSLKLKMSNDRLEVLAGSKDTYQFGKPRGQRAESGYAGNSSRKDSFDIDERTVEQFGDKKDNLGVWLTKIEQVKLPDKIGKLTTRVGVLESARETISLQSATVVEIEEAEDSLRSTRHLGISKESPS